MSDGITTAPSPASSGTTITPTNATLWFQGDVVDVPAVSEQFLITSADQTAPFTIVRAYNETTAGSITSSHRLFKNPRFGTAQIEEAIDTFVRLKTLPEIYELKTTTVTPSPTTTVLYDMPTDFEEFVEMYQTSSGAIEDIRRVPVDSELWNVSTTIAASGKALRVRGWPRNDVDGFLTYKAKASSATTDVSLQKLIALGAANHLLIGESAQKAGDPHVSDFEVQKILRAANFVEQDYLDARSSFASSQRKKTGLTRFFQRARWASR